MAIHISNVAASAEMDALTALLNTGYIRVYDGTRPATVNTALSGNNLLAEARFQSTAFPASTNGVAVANAITSVAVALTGTASFYRLLKSDGTTAIQDGDVGTSGSDMNIATTSLVAAATFAVPSITLTQPK